jgi:hypothetical protein
MPISGSFSATLAGFAPGGSWAQLSVSASSSRVLLPSGTVVVVYNVGANGAYVAIGNSGIVATTGEDYIPAGGALALTVGANTYIAGITSSSTTTLNISGGSGLPTGWGSGGGPNNPLSVAGSYAGPSSTLTSGTGTSLTSTNNFIASSATAGSIVVPYFTIGASSGDALSPKMNLTTNATSGWGGVSVTISFWTAAPTYTNGDGGVYAATTGSAVLLDQYTCTFIQYVDKAQAVCVPNNGPVSVLLPPSAKVYWDAYVGGTVTKASGQTFTLTDFVVN